MEHDRIIAMGRIIHILETIEKIENALEERIAHTEDPGFLVSSRVIEKMRRSPVVDIGEMALYESYVCTSGGCSLKQGHYNLLEDAGMKLDQLDLEIKKGATIERALKKVLDVSREEFGDMEAYA